MKICPNCRQTYTDEGLNFCLSDGSMLTVFTDDAPPTVNINPTRVTNQTRWQPPTNFQQQPNYQPPAVWQNQQNLQNQPFNNPMRIHSQDQTLPTISLIIGILSILLICCWGGIPLGTAAIITGIIALNHEKNDPTKYGGRGLAMGGIITGAVAFALGIGYFILIILPK